MLTYTHDMTRDYSPADKHGPLPIIPNKEENKVINNLSEAAVEVQ